MEVPVHSPPAPESPTRTGELIVQNGRLAGSRKALSTAVNVIGRAEGCDIRLNGEGVQPLHCVLLDRPDGIHLRTLPGPAVVLVNGHPLREAVLQTGDQLAIGPFQFLVHQPELAADPLDEERAALRIQAAAVAAQQVALTEEEYRLQQRWNARQHQETQLAAHLEQRQKKLVRYQQRLHRVRRSLRQEQTAHEVRTTQTTNELTRQHQELDEAREALLAERKRLARQFHQLRRRHARQRKGSRLELRRWHDRLVAQAGHLEREKANLIETRLRHNGETELSRRQIQDAWQELRSAQSRWRQRRMEQRADIDRGIRAVAEREFALADAQLLLEQERRQWDHRRAGLEVELQGLERRVRHLRGKLQDYQEALRPELPCPVTESRTAPPSPSSPPSPREPEGSSLAPLEERLLQRQTLEQMADDLRDHRLILLEQGERLLALRQHWQEEHTAALAELEQTAAGLVEREQALLPRERSLEEAEAALCRRGEQVARRQADLEAWQTRLRVEAVEREASYQTLLANLRHREELAEQKLQLISSLRLRWSARRRLQYAALHTEIQHFQQARREQVLLWEECVQVRAALEQGQRALAERNLALEQYRVELLARAGDSAAAEKQLKRLRRRMAGINAAALRQMANERRTLTLEARRLDSLAHVLNNQARAVALQAEEFARAREEWEQITIEAADSHAREHVQVRDLSVQRDLQERQLAALRDEVERLGGLLLEEGPVLLPLVKAA